MYSRLAFLLLLACGGFAQQTRFILTGDSIINRRLSVHQEPGFVGMIERIRSADVAFTNLETLIHNFEMPGAPASGGTYMGSPAWILDELKWAGFDLFSFANNHAMDFGAEGLLSTLRALDAAGVAHAGAAENLARARAPAYLDTAKGRVALIACASTFPPGSLAGPQRPDMKGRPGLNPLRFNTTYSISRSTLDELRKIAPSSRGGAGTQPASLQFLGARFIEGAPGVRTEPNAADLKEIAASIREARRQADWVVVSIHAHEGAPGNRETPAEFLVTFARAAIDAGADLFVGHGPHVLRPVEVYNGKPIFYSVANFIFENETVRFQPGENFESLSLAANALPADFFDARSANGTRGFPADKLNWESVIAEAVFDATRKLTAMRFIPITLGFGESRTRRGRPMPATPEAGRAILDRLAGLSKAFGTNIAVEQGEGVWPAKP